MPGSPEVHEYIIFMAPEPFTLTARWIFPVDQPPLPRGTITIQGDRIVSVDKAGTRTADIDLGNAAILPGFVNAHTHLDLSDALGRCPPTPDFTAWLRAVIAHRRRQTPEDVAKAIDTGLAQCLRYGTTLVGDISSGGMSWERLTESPLRAVVFYELLGLSMDRAQTSWVQTMQWIDDRRSTKTCVAGLSPHAPYSTSDWLFQKVADYTDFGTSWGGEYDCKVAIHLAESVAELLLLENKSGPFVEFLSELGVWNPEGLVPNLQKILDYRFSRGALFIHGNYLSPSAKLPGFLVYCPRTHAAFGHPTHRFREFGNPVALGTDSLASNPDLDILAEARFIHEKNPDFPGAILLTMATRSEERRVGKEC
jgi:aminodeoxyfutalosine deaminase